MCMIHIIKTNASRVVYEFPTQRKSTDYVISILLYLAEKKQSYFGNRPGLIFRAQAFWWVHVGN